MKIYSYGKYNLTLKITYYNRSKDMHKIKSIVFPYTDIYDVVELVPNSTSVVNFWCNNKNIDQKNNSVINAYNKFIEFFPIYKNYGFNIKLYKNSTIGSGLGYSASNAVALINLLCQFYNIDYRDKSIRKLVITLGSDALFFYYGVPAKIYGYGDKIKILSSKVANKYYIPNIIVITNKITSCSKYVYAEYRKDPQFYKSHVKILNKKYYNYLQLPALKINEKLKNEYEVLTKKYNNVMLSGSGGSFLVW